MVKINEKFIKKNYKKNGVPNNTGHQEKKKDQPPPLTLVPEEVSEETRETWKKSQFTLKAVPNDPNSSEVKAYVYHNDGTQGLRAAIEWKMNMERVLRGLNVDTPVNAIAIIEDCCAGSAKAAFQNFLTSHRADYEEAIQDAVDAEAALPANTLQQRRDNARAAATQLNQLTMNDVQVALRSVVEEAAPTRAYSKQRRYM